MLGILLLLVAIGTVYDVCFVQLALSCDKFTRKGYKPLDNPPAYEESNAILGSHSYDKVYNSTDVDKLSGRQSGYGTIRTDPPLAKRTDFSIVANEHGENKAKEPPTGCLNTFFVLHRFSRSKCVVVLLISYINIIVNICSVVQKKKHYKILFCIASTSNFFIS